VQAYGHAVASEQSSDNFDPFGAMGSLNVVGSDLRQIDRKCGVRQSAAKHQSV
jgi:hypothetical protein